MKKLLSCFLLIPILSSCNKTKIIKGFFANTNNSTLNSLLSYTDVFTKKTNAVFGLVLSAPMSYEYSSTIMPPNYTFQGEFINDNGILLKGGQVQVGSTTFNCNPAGKALTYGGDKTLKIIDYAGYNTSFSFQKPLSFTNPNANTGTQFGAIIKENLYIPQLLDVKLPKYEYDAALNTISIGSIFKWNIDLGNYQNGVLIGVEYDPNSYGNTTFKTTNPNYVIHGELIADNGSYQIPESLFKGIAAGAEVKIMIGRANYKLFTDTEGIPFTLYAYNSKYGFYKYK